MLEFYFLFQFFFLVTWAELQLLFVWWVYVQRKTDAHYWPLSILKALLRRWVFFSFFNYTNLQIVSVTIVNRFGRTRRKMDFAPILQEWMDGRTSDRTPSETSTSTRIEHKSPSKATVWRRGSDTKRPEKKGNSLFCLPSRSLLLFFPDQLMSFFFFLLLPLVLKPYTADNRFERKRGRKRERERENKGPIRNYCYNL